jgi:protein TonB
MSRLQLTCVGSPIVLGSLMAALAVTSAAQPPAPSPARKILNRAVAAFPPALLSSGVDAGVSLRATVDTGGSVVSLDSPSWQIVVYHDSQISDPGAFWSNNPGQAFVDAAENAARQFRFEPGERESTSVLSFSFQGHRVMSRITSSVGATMPLRVGGNISAPAKVRDVKPVYPADAQAAKVQGVVIVEATIGTDGSVVDARVLRSIPMLDQAAIDAVKQWQFTPTLLNGAAVPVIMTVTVNFWLQ